MKRMLCEMCGSADIIKEDGVFVCQACGMKYSVEETNDNSESAVYDKIIKLARDAYNDKRFDSAYDYYCQAVEMRQDVVENSLRQGLAILAKTPIKSSIPAPCISRVMRAIELVKQMPDSEEKGKTILSAIEDLNSACDVSADYLIEEINELELQKITPRSASDVFADLARPVIISNLNSAEDKRIEKVNAAIDEKIYAIRTRIKIINDFKAEYVEKFLEHADINTEFICRYRAGKVDKIIELYPRVTLSFEEQKVLTEENNYVFWATKHARPDFLNVLVKMGSNVNKSTAEVSPLFVVTAHAYKDEVLQQKCITMARILLLHGAKINPDERDSTGRYLVNTDTPEVIKNLLIEKNPDVKNKIAKAPRKKGGCYVATAVYGSYDCPEVWTLRRYRDYTLAKTWKGRAFIKIYYAISPTLVKWFGHTKWFKKMWQGKLDRMVAKLQANGVDSTPYEDKEW